MTDETSNDDQLFEEALDLIIRLQNDPSSPVARDLINRWRARGPEHEAAWAEAAEIHGMAGKVIEDRRQAEETRSGVSRRTIILGGVAGLVAVGAGAALGPELWLQLRADHLTSTAELRRVALADDTIVTLGPDSAIRNAFTPSLRRIELLAGMAFFEVAPDSSRPFEVLADGVTAIALGTAFDVSIDAGFLTLAVDRGRVEMERPGSAAAPRETLADGGWLTFDKRTLHVEQGTRAAGEVALWREGMIVAERERIAAVVARIARWQPGRVLILDPGLGAQRISGVFDLRNPLTALDAVVQPRGGRVRQISPWLTVISSV